MRGRLNPETGVKKPFENVFYVRGHIQNFFQREGTNYCHYSCVSFFSTELILSNLSYKNDSRGGSGGMFPKKIVKIC